MVQRRAVDMCPQGDAARPYPVWPEPDWPLGKDQELGEALAQLELALTECDVALANTIAALTSQDVNSALRSVPFEQWPAVLRPLGLRLKPRQITQALCQDVRLRLQRADQHAARHAASALTINVSIDVERSVFPDKDEDPSQSRDPLERWDPALRRLAVWSRGVASVRDARIWLWAIQQPWFRPDGVSDEQLEEIVEAAERVVMASPKFTHLTSVGDMDRRSGESSEASADDDGSGEGGRDGLQADDRPAGSAAGHDVARMPHSELGRDMIEDTVAGAVGGEFKSAGAIGKLGTPQDTAAAADALDTVMAEGLQAARDVVAQLSAQRPPRHEDLAALRRTRETFDTVVALLTAAGMHVAEETVAAVRVAVEQVKAAAGDADMRARLEIVCALVALPEQAILHTQLSQVQSEARDLLALQQWDAQVRRSAAVVGLLAELATAAYDATAQMTLMQQWSEARPDLSFLALHARQLALPACPAAPAGTAPGATPADRIADVGPEAATVPAPPAASPVKTEAPEQAVEQKTGSAGTSDPLRTKEVALEPKASFARSRPEVMGLAAQRTEFPVAQPRAPAGSGATSQPDQFLQAKPQATAAHGVELADDLIEAEDQLPDGRAKAVVGHLISAQRFALAALIEGILGWSPTQRTALRVAALAGVVRNQAGLVAAALRAEFDDLDPAALAGDTPSLLLTVSALLRTALVTGEPTTGALLADLASHVEPNLSQVAEQVGRRALHGVLLDSQALSVLADVTEIERGMQAIIGDASRVRTRHRTLRFKRATDISKIWLDPDGILGRPLRLVERNEMSAVKDVTAEIEQLSNSNFIKSQLDTLDRRLQGSSGKRLQGAGKQDLLNLVEETLKPLADWVEAVRSLGGHDAHATHWSAGEVAEMRSAVLERRHGVLTTLERLTSHSDPLTVAAAHAAHASLTVTFDILHGTRTLPVREPAPALTLTAELLKVPGVSVDTVLRHVTLPRDLPVRVLLEAVERNWDEALIAQVEAENFEAAQLLQDIAAEQLPVAEGQYVTLAADRLQKWSRPSVACATN